MRVNMKNLENKVALVTGPPRIFNAVSVMVGREGSGSCFLLTVLENRWHSLREHHFAADNMRGLSPSGLYYSETVRQRRLQAFVEAR